MTVWAMLAEPLHVAPGSYKFVYLINMVKRRCLLFFKVRGQGVVEIGIETEIETVKENQRKTDVEIERT